MRSASPAPRPSSFGCRANAATVSTAASLASRSINGPIAARACPSAAGRAGWAGSWPQRMISVEPEVAIPQLARAAGRFGDEGGQFGPVGYGKRYVCPSAAARWSAIGLRPEVSVREQSDVECGQDELRTAPGVGPAKWLRDRDVDRQGTHVGRDVTAHGRMLACTRAPGGAGHLLTGRNPTAPI